MNGECHFTPHPTMGGEHWHSSESRFCPDCGCAKKDAPSLCGRYRSDLKKKEAKQAMADKASAMAPYTLQSDRTPKQWTHKYSRHLFELWVDYIAGIESPMADPPFGRWYPGETRKIPLKMEDGKWGRQDVSWPLLRGSPEHIALRNGGHVYGRQFYWQREWAEKVFDRIIRRQYISSKQKSSIVRRLKDKHGDHYGRYFCDQDQHGADCLYGNQYGYIADGEFSPVNLGELGPAYKQACSFCGEGLAAGSIDPLDDAVALKETWPDANYKDDAICGSELCQEASDWATGKNRMLIVEARKYKVTANRPKDVTLNKYPPELRGSLILARYLDFQARYTEARENP